LRAPDVLGEHIIHSLHHLGFILSNLSMLYVPNPSFKFSASKKSRLEDGITYAPDFEHKSEKNVWKLGEG
jgi:hypothetical protein